jgi:hypothetical protein
MKAARPLLTHENCTQVVPIHDCSNIEVKTDPIILRYLLTNCSVIRKANIASVIQEVVQDHYSASHKLPTFYSTYFF